MSSPLQSLPTHPHAQNDNLTVLVLHQPLFICIMVEAEVSNSIHKCLTRGVCTKASLPTHTAIPHSRRHVFERFMTSQFMALCSTAVINTLISDTSLLPG